MRILLSVLAILALFSCTKEEITEVTDVTQVNELNALKEEALLCFELENGFNCQEVDFPDGASEETHTPFLFYRDEFGIKYALPTETVLVTDPLG